MVNGLHSNTITTNFYGNHSNSHSSKYQQEQTLKQLHTAYDSDPDPFVTTDDSPSHSLSSTSLLSNTCHRQYAHDHSEQEYPHEIDHEFNTNDEKDEKPAVTSNESNIVTSQNNIHNNNSDFNSKILCANTSPTIDSRKDNVSTDTSDMDARIKHAVRVPLGRVVTSLVNRWSMEYVKEAEKGDGEAMCLVAQMCLDKNGWGCVQNNEANGKYWLDRARSKGYNSAANQLEDFYGISSSPSIPNNALSTFSTVIQQPIQL